MQHTFEYIDNAVNINIHIAQIITGKYGNIDETEAHRSTNVFIIQLEAAIVIISS